MDVSEEDVVAEEDPSGTEEMKITLRMKMRLGTIWAQNLVFSGDK